MHRILLILTAWALTAWASSLTAGEWTPLWAGLAPGASQPPPGTEQTLAGGRLTDIERPSYRLYPAPDKPRSGQAVVIFPGGGYSLLAMKHEGVEYARWLNARGITAMVVKYRVSGRDELGYQFPVPLLDARRAIRTMRARGEELGISSVGVMGSSAGGHLASLCATRFNDRFESEGVDPIDCLDSRPDFAVMIYPVICSGALAHRGSFRRLAGATPGADLMRMLSTEKHVTAETPPCFLVTTADDRVDCRHSLDFARACKAAGVPVALHLFEKGGHGYGLNGRGNVAAWPELLGDWLELRAETASRPRSGEK